MEKEIKYKGILFNVEFEYQPEERPERGPEAKYPGFHEAVEVNGIKHKETCFYDFMNKSDFNEIEKLILAELKY